MSLQVWLPMTKDLRQQGLSDIKATNNGAIFNSTGKLGGCYSFGTGASSLSLPESFFTSFVDDFSIACWVKFITWNSSYATVWAATSTSASWKNIMAGLFRNGSSSKILFCIGNDSSSTQSSCITTEDIQLNTWYHFVCTYTSGKICLYQNGILVSSYNTSIIPKFSSTQYFNIGKMRENTYQTNSNIGDFRIYNHCLSPMEVKELAKGLVLHYPLDRKGWGQENLATQYVVPGTNGPLVTTTSNGHTIYYDKYGIIIPATENADTYFSIYLKQALESGKTYTLSCKVSGLLSGTYYNFPLFAQGNSSMGLLKLDHNGLCSLTFTMNYTGTVATSTVNGVTLYRLFMDDTSRKIASGQGAITITNIKLEEGEKATSWCPATTDSFEYDCSGFCNNGTRTGTFTWTSDTPKYSASTYIPTSSYITHACCLDNSNQEWTCCAWVKLDDTVGSQNLNDFNYSNRIVHAANGTPLLYLNAGNNDYYMYGSQKVNANEWTHIAFVFKNSTELRNVYVNGVLTNSGGPNKTSTPSGIPATVKVGGSNFAGYMSDYREYATALSASDVKALYNANKL